MYDLVVIGAGVVGLAVSRHFQSTGGLQCLVVEQESDYGLGISSRNSEVLHAGFQYPPDTLKAKLCVEGRQRLSAYLRANSLPFNQCGKYVIAGTEATDELEHLHRQGQLNGVLGLEIVAAGVINQLYPELAPHPALYSPHTGLLSVDSLMRHLAGEFRAKGGDLAVQTRFVGMTPTPRGYTLMLADSAGKTISIEAERVINAAGLSALSVAAAAGFEYEQAGYQLRYCQGAYFKLPAARGKFRHLIYPVPTNTSLGIHIRLDLQQEVSLGPDARYMPDSIEDYTVDPGLEKEFRRKVRHYWPAIDRYNLVPDMAGIRPHLFINGELHHDFQVIDENGAGCPGWMNLFGIDSPGLTSALAFGPYIAELWS